MKLLGLFVLLLPAAAIAQTQSAPAGADQNGQQAQSGAQGETGERRVCRYEEDSASRMGRRRVCRTEAEWRSQRD